MVAPGRAARLREAHGREAAEAEGVVLEEAGAEVAQDGGVGPRAVEERRRRLGPGRRRAEARERRGLEGEPVVDEADGRGGAAGRGLDRRVRGAVRAEHREQVPPVRGKVEEAAGRERALEEAGKLRFPFR